MSDDAERTYEATDTRREEFRKQGRFAQAKDIGGLAATVGSFGAIVAGRDQLGHALAVLFQRTIGDVRALEHPEAVRGALVAVAAQVAPLLAGATVLAVLASGAQTRFRPNLEAISMNLDRLNPVNGFGRIFAFKKNAMQLLFSLLRAGLVGGLSWQALKRDIPILLGISRSSIWDGAQSAASTVANVGAAALLGLVLIAAADYAYSWFTLEQELKMTRQERMEESRSSEGDPKAKARQKQRARQLAKKRALNAVKNADVIVTNPTHVAVALRYGPKDAAPVVLAKGLDDVALEIRAEARRNGIPILENRPLARALYAEVVVGKIIPAQHFAAVAQILAFVFKLKKRGAFRGTRRA